MRIECVIDSSSIISLCKCGLSDYLALTNWEFISVERVFSEVVEEGINKGELDALAASKVFDSGRIRLVKSKTASKVDDELVLLAKEKQIPILTNDVKLARKARIQGTGALHSPDLCLLLLKTRKISVEKYRNALLALVDKKRLSQNSGNEYLKEGGL